MAYKAVGNTIVEWDDNAPFIFTLVEKSGPENARVMCSETINLTPLRASCEDAFLLHLKESLIESRNRLSLTTVKSQAKEFVGLFGKMTALDVFDTKVSFVDESFLLSLGAVLDQIPNRYSSALANLFDAAPSSPLFAKGLQKATFPCERERRGGTAERSIQSWARLSARPPSPTSSTNVTLRTLPAK
ncbi:MAG: hypothetical protein IPH08_11770 [Rhodocyclaceae bacterium]|nr:hypothetical protein [Rhodocyclaceae bacterium]